MSDVLAAIAIAIGGAVWLFGAAMLIGAVIAVLRADHRNPLAYRWVRWYGDHSSAGHRHPPK